jgi:hypothetical protein
MTRGLKIALFITLGLVFLGSGLFRDFVFMNVNEQIRVVYYHSPDSVLAPSMKFLEQYSYSTLYYAKWGLTFLFTFLFMGLTLGFVRLLFKEKRFIRLTLWAYAFLFVAAGLFFLGGFLAGHSENGYTVARFLMGMAQGPIVLMVLIPAFKLLGSFEGYAGKYRGKD